MPIKLNYAIDDLDNAFKHFFRRVKAKQKAGFPRFKKKDLRDSFALRESVKFDVIGRELRLEKLKKNRIAPVVTFSRHGKTSHDD